MTAITRLPALVVGSVILCASLPAQTFPKIEPVPPKPAPAQPVQQVRVPENTQNSWFDVTQLDLGTFLEGETAKGEFRFKNPSADETHQLKNFSPSCTCSHTIIHVGGRRYELANDPKPNSIYRVDDPGPSERTLVQHVAVGPGEDGRVEVELNLRGVAGVKEATVSLQTSDEELRFVSLKTVAKATTFFTVMPSEINLNKMSWKDQRQFTAQITSPLQDDFEITGHDPLPPRMQVEYRKEMRDDKAVWIVDGTYGPNVDPHAGGGIINFQTDIQDKKVQVRVMAWVEGPLTYSPGAFLALGMIRSGKGASKVVEIEPTDDFALEVVKLELQNLSVPEEFIKVTSEMDGNKVKIKLTITPDVPRRLIRGDLLVFMNHPAAQQKEFQFNGFVR